MIRVLVLLFSILASINSAKAVSAGDRIVVLAPVLAEWSAEVLGTEQALKRIVGAVEYSDYPVELKKIERVGAYPQLNIEKIASLKPSLVVASSEYNRAAQLEQLKRLKLPVRVLPKESFLKMESWVTELGNVLGEPKGARAAIARWKKSLSELKPKKRVKRILIQIQESPLVAVGGESFLNDAFLAAGYENIFSKLKQAYPKVSREAVLSENPDQIFIVDMTGNADDFKPSIEGWQKFGSLKAVLEKELRIISGDDFARCSPRLLNALKRLQSL